MAEQQTRSSFFNLLRAEWLKLSRRPMAWILLMVFLFQMILFLSVIFLVVALHDGIFGDASIRMMEPEQIEQFRLRLGFPGIFGEVLGQVNGIGGFLAVVLAAGALGSEYSWGTLRVQLARQPHRGRYLVVKVVSLLLILLAGILIALVVGIVFGLFYSATLGDIGTVRFHDVFLLPVGVLRSLYVALPYLLFTFAICVLGRSIMAGVAGGILFITVDASTGVPSLLAAMENPLVRFFYNLLVQQNVNTLVFVNRQDFGLDPAIGMNLDPALLPSPLQATAVIALYCALFFGYAYVLFTRRDITGPS